MRILCLAAIFSIGACTTSTGEAYLALHQKGFQQIQIGAVQPNVCSPQEQKGRFFEAEDPAGEDVSGVVCCEFWGPCRILL